MIKEAPKSELNIVAQIFLWLIQVSEIAEAVEEVKQFVRPTREKVFDPQLLKNCLFWPFFLCLRDSESETRCGFMEENSFGGSKIVSSELQYNPMLMRQ